MMSWISSLAHGRNGYGTSPTRDSESLAENRRPNRGDDGGDGHGPRAEP